MLCSLQRGAADLRWGNPVGAGEAGLALLVLGFTRGPEGEEEARPLGPELALKYRAIAARAHFLRLGRPDSGCAAKECSRRMSAPSTQDWLALV